MAEVDDSDAFGAERSEPAAVRRVCGGGGDVGMQKITRKIGAIQTCQIARKGRRHWFSHFS
jgi:hypothetical protein